VFVVMNFLYFTNIIPPIPLSLKDAGVYHKVERIAPGEYLVLGEEKIWYDRLKLYQTFTLSSENRTIYLYAAVFAPTELTTNIVHHWHYFDESKKRWVSISRITYAITGGRDGGFRGYSYKTNVFPGRWRVDVETLRGQLIGRVRFVAHEAIESPQIKREIK
jgi:hypothetical protein